MKSKLLLGILITAAIQLATPAYLVARHERTLRDGEVFRFHTAPVDPYDAFRGRYVALAVEPNRVKLDDPAQSFKHRQKIFVTLDRDADGFATLRGANVSRPKKGAYLSARAWGVDHEGYLRVRLPMDRYYLPEDEAPEAERAYREHSRVGQRTAEVQVRVLRGEGVIEDLVVDGRPIRAWLAERQEAP